MVCSSAEKDFARKFGCRLQRLSITHVAASYITLKLYIQHGVIIINPIGNSLKKQKSCTRYNA